MGIISPVREAVRSPISSPVAGGGGPVVPPAFVSLWDTTKTSAESSNATSIKIPTVNGGTYNCVVDWGDGTFDTITTWDDAKWTHDYGVGNGGLKTVRITGQFWGLRFAGVGDRLKILSVPSFGPDFRLLPFAAPGGGQQFSGCNNLVTINPDVSLVGCVSLTRAFQFCFVFNADLSGWDVSKVGDLAYAFWATKINCDFSAWRPGADPAVSSISLQGTFAGVNTVDSNFGSWPVSKASSMTDFMHSARPDTMSVANLDATYNGWAAQAVKPNISVTFGTAKYSSAGAAGRAILTGAPNNWTITDGGMI